jgi:hypothetical protein
MPNLHKYQNDNIAGTLAGREPKINYIFTSAYDK